MIARLSLDRLAAFSRCQQVCRRSIRRIAAQHQLEIGKGARLLPHADQGIGAKQMPGDELFLGHDDGIPIRVQGNQAKRPRRL